MKETVFQKVIKSLKDAGKHNSGIMIKPEVILWLDPERQWESVIPIFRDALSELLTLGEYLPEIKQGPAIWIKCMVAKTLPEADWDNSVIPIIYLPAISKSDFKDISSVKFDLQPLIEYQYTGTFFNQINGKEWTIKAFFENEQSGLGLKVASDLLTKEALIKTLPIILKKENIDYPELINAEFLNALMFPNATSAVLNWICKGDEYLKNLSPNEKAVFTQICKLRFNFTPDYKNIIAIVGLLGTQNHIWRDVWDLYAAAPTKYKELENLLRLAKPEEPVYELFEYNKSSFPQENEKCEDELRLALEDLLELNLKEVEIKLNELELKNSFRRSWVWAELGYSPLSKTLPHLIKLTQLSTEPFPFSNLDELTSYYISNGYNIDREMRYVLKQVKSDKDKKIIKALIHKIYKPWLQLITQKFQKLVELDVSNIISNKTDYNNEEYILFVDALRYELATELAESLRDDQYKVNLSHDWSALPSLTATSKPNVSPIKDAISKASCFVDFRPQLNDCRELTTNVFREILEKNNYNIINNYDNVRINQKHWQEIGDIDTRGHEEQSELVKRIDELFDKVKETINSVFEKGIKKIKIVTDHGWLLLPNGLPKEELNINLTETKWGRCALVKEGVKTNFLQLPWHWNNQVFITYAPGISFFKKNEEYAHGGISLHECLIPIITIEQNNLKTILPKITSAKWVGLVCKVETIDTPEGYLVDVRLQYDNENSSIVESDKSKRVKNNKASVMVDDDAFNKSAIIVLVNENGLIIDKQLTLVGERN